MKLVVINSGNDGKVIPVEEFIIAYKAKCGLAENAKIRISKILPSKDKDGRWIVINNGTDEHIFPVSQKAEVGASILSLAGFWITDDETYVGSTSGVMEEF